MGLRRDLAQRGLYTTLFGAFAVELVALSVVALGDIWTFLAAELLLQPIAGFIVGYVMRGGWAATTAGVLGVGVVIAIWTRGGLLAGLVVMAFVGLLLFAPGYLIGQAARPVEEAGLPGAPEAGSEDAHRAAPVEGGAPSTWSSSQMSFAVGPPLSRAWAVRARVIAAGVIVAIDVLIAISIANTLSHLGP